jgi:hypothetical protein
MTYDASGRDVPMTSSHGFCMILVIPAVHNLHAYLLKHFVSRPPRYRILSAQEPLAHEAVPRHDSVFWSRVVLNPHLKGEKRGGDEGGG